MATREVLLGVGQGVRGDAGLERKRVSVHDVLDGDGSLERVSLQVAAVVTVAAFAVAIGAQTVAVKLEALGALAIAADADLALWRDGMQGGKVLRAAALVPQALETITAQDPLSASASAKRSIVIRPAISVLLIAAVALAGAVWAEVQRQGGLHK